jgi:hypothetical protein
MKLKKTMKNLRDQVIWTNLMKSVLAEFKFRALPLYIQLTQQFWAFSLDLQQRFVLTLHLTYKQALLVTAYFYIPAVTLNTCMSPTASTTPHAMPY